MAWRDRNLMAKLRRELPGILQWAVNGCLAWQKDGLAVPQVIGDAVREYRKSQDPVGRFIEERCTESPDCWTASSVLYDAYKRWAGEEGEPELKEAVFGRRLTQLGFQRARGGQNRNHGRLGIRLTQPPN
jgi:putative DNA primase/helicase